MRSCEHNVTGSSGRIEGCVQLAIDAEQVPQLGPIAEIGVNSMTLGRHRRAQAIQSGCGEAGEGIIFPAGRLLAADTLADDHPQKKVLMEYKKKYEAEFKEPVSTFGGHAYDALHIVVAAMKNIEGDITPTKIRDEIEKVKGFVGTGGIFNYSETEHTGLDKEAFEMLTIKGGKFVVLED